MPRPSPPSLSDAQLQALVAVADEGSFTQAARRLRITQSAVSHALAALEEALRVELLVRSARGVKLTAVGERVVEHAREVLRLKALILSDADADRRLQGGIVRVGSFGPSASRQLLPSILDSFAQRFPGITVRIAEGTDQEIEHWLRQGRVDVGFVTLPSREFDTTGLVEDEMVVLLPAGHPLAAQPSIAPAQLAPYPFILSTGGCEPAILAHLQGEGLDVRYEIREVYSIIDMVSQGTGISIAPVLALPDPLPPRVEIRPLDPPCPRRIGLGVKDRHTLSPAARAFLEVAAVVHRDT